MIPNDIQVKSLPHCVQGERHSCIFSLLIYLYFLRHLKEVQPLSERLFQRSGVIAETLQHG